MESSDEGDVPIGDTLREIAKELFGEKLRSDISFREAVELSLGIKLESTAFDITTNGKNSVTPYQIAQLKAKAIQLADLLNGKPRTWKAERDEKGKHIVKPTSEPGVDRSFTQIGDPFGTKWIWLREDEVP